MMKGFKIIFLVLLFVLACHRQAKKVNYLDMLKNAKFLSENETVLDKKETSLALNLCYILRENRMLLSAPLQKATYQNFSCDGLNRTKQVKLEKNILQNGRILIGIKSFDNLKEKQKGKGRGLAFIQKSSTIEMLSDLGPFFMPFCREVTEQLSAKRIFNINGKSYQIHLEKGDDEKLYMYRFEGKSFIEGLKVLIISDQTKDLREFTFEKIKKCRDSPFIQKKSLSWVYFQ